MKSTLRRLGSLLAISILLVLAAPSSVMMPVKAQAVTKVASPAEIVAQPEAISSQFQANGKLSIAYHPGTGRLSFVGAHAEAPIPQPSPLPPGATPDEAARSFLAAYGGSFGIQDPAKELAVMKEDTTPDGRSFVRYQQVFQGVPVLGGELIVQLNGKKDVLSVNGEALPDLDVSTLPGVSAAEALQIALEAVAKNDRLPYENLKGIPPELWIYNPSLLGVPGLPLSRLAWRVEVSTRDLQPVRELVLVDAQNGEVLLSFNQVDTLLNRVIYDNNNNPTSGLPGQGPVRTEGTTDSLISDVDRAFEYSKAAYDFYLTNHGRDSLDGLGMSLVSTVRYCSPSEPCPYKNGFWNGSQVAFGEGFASADDIIGHEFTHAVTQYTSRLFYYMQSGAINESLSDIWGEFIDLSYPGPYDNDSPAVRWLVGEDVPIYGPLRSMSNPPAYAAPDKMSSGYYDCRTRDNGGVHTNSGVGNKAAFLMVDGGNFNGYTIPGLGLQKVAKIFYEAQTHLLTSAADYQDLANALSQSCLDLIATAGINAADCDAVRKTIAAVEMTQQPAMCAAPEAPLCDRNVFDSQFNAELGGWHAASGVWNVDSNYAYTGGEANKFVSLVGPESSDDFEYVTMMRRYGCDLCPNGVFIRGTPVPMQSDNSWSTGYAFLYNRSGSVSVWRLDGSYRTVLMDWVNISAINPGDAWNTIKVTASRDKYSFYINDHLVWTGMDDHFLTGLVGLGMYRNAFSSGDLLQVDRAELKGGTPISLFSDGFENGLANWSRTALQGADLWTNEQGYARSGNYALHDPNHDTVSDSYAQIVQGVALPPLLPAYLRFDHAYDFNDGGTPLTHYDGGVVEYSVTGGALWIDAGILPAENGYTGSIPDDLTNHSNPLVGRMAFVGRSSGYISTRVSLEPLKGNTIRLRFRTGYDFYGTPALGWYIDNVQIYTCVLHIDQAYLPVIMASNTSVTSSLP